MMPQSAVMTCGLRVLIADDHAIVCEGLKQIISSDPAFMVIAEVNTAAQARPSASCLNLNRINTP